MSLHSKTPLVLVALALALPALSTTTAKTAPPERIKAFEDWPSGAAPADVGKRVAENYVARDIERWNTGFVIYPEVCAWYGSLTLAALSGDKDLQRRLVARFDPLLTPDGAKRISPRAHVDYRVFGAVPLEIYFANKDPRVARTGAGTRGRAVAVDDAGRDHHRGALLDRRHVHDHGGAGTGLSRHR